MVMKAVVRTSTGVALTAVAEPRGETVVRVAYAGVCRSDLAAAEGRVPVAPGRVLGHELAGWLDDQPVAVVPFSPCDVCPSCLVHRACDRPIWLGFDADGAFAEQVAVPGDAILMVPPELPLLRAAYVEPVAAALGALVAVERDARVLVSGAGRIAELTARVVAADGGIVERHAPGEPLPHRDFDVAIEHASNGAELVAALRRGGTLVLKSRAREILPLDGGELVARDLVVRGASHGSFTTALDWLVSGRIAIDDLIAPPRRLEDFRDVFAAARRESHKQMFAIAEHP
jgi:L-iditol 2-dehydrogenase